MALAWNKFEVWRGGCFGPDGAFGALAAAGGFAWTSVGFLKPRPDWRLGTVLKTRISVKRYLLHIKGEKSTSKQLSLSKNLPVEKETTQVMINSSSLNNDTSQNQPSKLHKRQKIPVAKKVQPCRLSD